MLDRAFVLLIDGFHDEFYQEGRFAAQFFQVYFERIIGAVHCLAVVQKVGHFHRKFHGFVGIFDVERIVCAVFGNDRKVAFAREVAQGGFHAQDVFRTVGFGRQQVGRPQIYITNGCGEDDVRGFIERHLQRIGRYHPVESQRTGQTVVQISRRGFVLRRNAQCAPGKYECQKNLFHTHCCLMILDIFQWSSYLHHVRGGTNRTA